MFNFLPASTRDVHNYAFIRFDDEKMQGAICCIIGYDANLRTEVRSTQIKSLTCDDSGSPVSATTMSGSTYIFNGQALTEFNSIKGLYHLECAIGLDRGAIYQLIDGKTLTLDQFLEINALNKQLNHKIDALVSPIEVDGKLVGIRHKTMTVRIIKPKEALALIESGTLL